MPQSGVLATPHKGLKKEYLSRTSERRHRKGFKRNATVGRWGDITERSLKEMPQSDVGATSQKRALKETPQSDVGATSQKGL